MDRKKERGQVVEQVNAEKLWSESKMNALVTSDEA